MSEKEILVVEDDPVMRLATKLQLDKLGYKPQLVGSAEEALKLDLSKFSLILMDIGLPGIDGCHASLLIREQELKEHRKRVPIVAFTAHSDKQTSFLAGMDDHMQKPALLADFERVLTKWLPEPSSGTH